jgi:hypothetical protein
VVLLGGAYNVERRESKDADLFAAESAMKLQ